MKQMFMIDIESTGVDIKKDSVLQIAIVEMNKIGNGTYRSGRFYETVLPYSGEPISKFAKENMAGIYIQANRLFNQRGNIPPEVVRGDIKAFLKSCDAEDKPVFCGWNVSNFDLAMLVQKGFLKAPGYLTINDSDTPVGDFDYRVYEMGGIVHFLVDVLNIDKKELLTKAEEIGRYFDPSVVNIRVKDRSRHDALFDCVRQISILNGLLYKMRTEMFCNV